MNKSVIVLGGSGFLGTEILKALKSATFAKVACGNRQTCGVPGVVDVPTDVLNFANLKKSCQPFDIIINCVGQVTKPINTCLRLNSQGIENIIKVAKDSGKKVIQVSTVAIYGTAQTVDEETPANPETTYAAAKYFAEYLLLSNLPAKQLTIVRLSNLYGPNQPKGLFSYIKQSYHSDKKLVFNDNDGSLSRHYLHIEDAAQGIAELVRNPEAFGVFDLATQDKYSIKELVSLIEKETGVKLEVKYSQTPPLENIDSISCDKLLKTVKINPKHTVKNSLFDILE